MGLICDYDQLINYLTGEHSQYSKYARSWVLRFRMQQDSLVSSTVHLVCLSICLSLLLIDSNTYIHIYWFSCKTGKIVGPVWSTTPQQEDGTSELTGGHICTKTLPGDQLYMCVYKVLTYSTVYIYHTHCVCVRVQDCVLITGVDRTAC